MPSFDEAVAAEYERIKQWPMRSQYEGLALIEEKFQNLKHAVFRCKDPPGYCPPVSQRDREVRELVRIAARCKKFAVDVCREKE